MDVASAARSREGEYDSAEALIFDTSRRSGSSLPQLNPDKTVRCKFFGSMYYMPGEFLSCAAAETYAIATLAESSTGTAGLHINCKGVV